MWLTRILAAAAAFVAFTGQQLKAPPSVGLDGATVPAWRTGLDEADSRLGAAAAHRTTDQTKAAEYKSPRSGFGNRATSRGGK